MSSRYKGGILSATPPATTTSYGIWTVQQQMQARGASVWPSRPGAPTIGTATAGSTSASVAFTAPDCAGYPAITSYLATSTPGCFTNTGASSPIVVSGLTNGTSYTFKVKATNASGTGPCSAASNSVVPAIPTGSQSYTSAGTYSWVAPSGVTAVSVVAVGGGASGGYTGAGGAYPGGGGGGLGYKNNYSVTPGSSYTVVVGVGGPAGNGSTSTPTAGGNSSFVSTAVVKGGRGGRSVDPCSGTFTGDGGGRGGLGGCSQGGGGGAGGFSDTGGFCCRSGGAGRNYAGGFSVAGRAGVNGGAGGGASSYTTGACCVCTYRSSGGGGGVGLFGQGTSGAGGTGGFVCPGGGGGGSGGSAGSSGSANTGTAQGGSGGTYGGGGGVSGGCNTYGGAGGVGAVRIVWPGNTRQFPSTCVGAP